MLNAREAEITRLSDECAAHCATIEAQRAANLELQHALTQSNAACANLTARCTDLEGKLTCKTNQCEALLKEKAVLEHRVAILT